MGADKLPSLDVPRHARTLFGAISLALLAVQCGSRDSASTSQTTGAPTGGVSASPVKSSPAEPSVVASVPLVPSADASSNSSPSASVSSRPVASASVSAKPAPTATVVKKPRIGPGGIPEGAVEGRPFFVGDSAKIAPVFSVSGWDTVNELPECDLSELERAVLTEHFTQWAQGEHASIASFARFILHMLSVGAPAELLERATRALNDEIAHAQIGFAIVKAISGKQVGPGPFPIQGALQSSITLEDILRLNVREGMIGETLAALEAKIAVDGPILEPFKASFVKVAEDESRHAELAFVFAAWALQQNPSLESVIREEMDNWVPSVIHSPDNCEQFGVLNQQARMLIRQDGFAKLIKPLVEQLLRDNPITNTDTPSASAQAL